MENDVLICRCERVTERQILEAIKDGATTLAGVKKRTRACMGICQGKTCRGLVKRILVAQAGQNLEEIELLPSRARPPVRPLLLGDLAPLHPEERGGQG